MSKHGGDIYRNKVWVDFSVNISPYGIPSLVRAEVTKSLLNMGVYPDPLYDALRQSIASMEGVERDTIICGNGASELIYTSVRAIAYMSQNRSKVGVLSPCFSEYKKAAMAAGIIAFNEVILREEDFYLPKIEDIDKLFDDACLVILGNPNNPTGKLIPCEWLEEAINVATKKDAYIILDESFIDLTEYDGDINTLMTDKVIRIRSFTKSMAIPGIRLGYLYSTDMLLCERIKNQLPEWNVSVPAMYAGRAAVCCRSWLREKVRDKATGLSIEKEYLMNKLKEAGIEVFDSDTNFLLIKCERDLYSELLEKGILIRSCSDFDGLQEGYFRIAIKAHDDNEKLINNINALKEKKQCCNSLLSDGIMQVRPEEIEKTSFNILTGELQGMGINLQANTAAIVKRCIHTTADFEYAHTLMFSENAVSIFKNLIRDGAHIITDTNMALSGINKRELAVYGGEAHCFMADSDMAKRAKSLGKTRAYVSMQHAAGLNKKLIYVVGNAPTALVALCEMFDRGELKPDFVVGVPVGFVNVEVAKEMIMKREIPYIVNRGRKGGSNVAAAICNAILYEMRDEKDE